MRLRSPLLATALLVLAACSEHFTPTPQNMAGTYTATEFVVTTDGTAVDELAAGATVTMTLTEGGTTTGHLFVPDGNDDGTDLNADLTGTYLVGGQLLHFEHEADTFIRDMAFGAGEGSFGAEQLFGDTRIRLRMSRTGS